MKRIIITLAITSLAVFPLFSQNVTIPDANFLAALIEEGVDTNEDGQISYAEAEAVSDLRIYNKSITDMTGVETFINLKILFCYHNQLTSLNVSNNDSLTSLWCFENQLTSLDVSNNITLGNLECGNNQLTSLDLPNSITLHYLDCRNNQLTSLDISKNIRLSSLICDHNQLTSLDVSNNLGLAFGPWNWFSCSNNQLTSLDISNNIGLKNLDCSYNQLTTLDISNNVNLRGMSEVAHTGLLCNNNKLSSLNVPSCESLSVINCSANELVSLNISYCPNLEVFICNDNPNLSEVCVWELPLPTEENGGGTETTGSPNIYFTDCVAPELFVSDSLFQPITVEVTSTEDGVIYLVPQNTAKEIAIIRGECLDSVMSVADSPSNISLSAFDNGLYWLYARDSKGNISEPKSITIFGVGFNNPQINNFRLYPNPTSSLLTIETDQPVHHSIEIISLSGQLIYRAEMEGNSQQIDMTPFSKGIYFVTVRSDAWVRTEKVVRY